VQLPGNIRHRLTSSAAPRRTPRALLVEGSFAYVGGFTSDTTQAYGAEGFVARIKLGSGSMEASTRWIRPATATA